MFSISLLSLFTSCHGKSFGFHIFFPFLFDVIHFEYRNIIEGVVRWIGVHRKSNNINTTAMANDNTKKRVSLIARRTVYHLYCARYQSHSSIFRSLSCICVSRVCEAAYCYCCYYYYLSTDLLSHLVFCHIFHPIVMRV